MSGYLVPIIIGAVVLLLIFWVVGRYNAFVKGRNMTEEAFSTMDVYLKKRWDLVPNLVETVKGYAKHESETIENVIRARSAAYDGMSPDEKIDANQQLSAGLGRLMAIAEQYPDLKANTLFVNLSNQLGSIEQDIANARKYYNGVARQFNNTIMVFPGNMIAGMFGFKKQKMFETDAASRENVEVKF